MRRPSIALVWLAGLTFALCAAECRLEGAEAVGVVSHVKVLSDKVPDVSSLEAWKRSCLKEGMSDQKKALAVWETVVRFQHQDAPPLEYLHHENTVLDPIKLFNVYGYSFCSVASAEVQALARYAGLEARGWSIRAHIVPEVLWGGRWHMLDASLINYFPKPDGQIAGVEEIVQAVKAWLQEHPEYRGNGDKLAAFHREGGWTGWKRGPALLSACPWFGWDGWLPAATHGWYSTMQEYDGSTLSLYESGYSQGYQVNVQLRPGERLTRNWSNRGLHVNQRGGGDAPGCLTGKVGEGSLRYSPKFGDLAPGRVGNGTLQYDVPLAGGSWRLAALRAENLASKAEEPRGPAVHVRDPARPGVLELRMPSSYVYLSGTLAVEAAIGSGGRVAVAVSTNNGLDWQPVAELKTSGRREIDLAGSVFCRYDYRLRLTLEGRGTGIEALRLTHDVQHSQRPLPALDKGKNIIRFSAGPQEGTVTIEGSTDPGNKAKQLVYTDFHPIAEGVGGPLMRVQGSSGQITFPIATPGEMTRLRFGCFYRARDAADRWDLEVSFDNGKTFRTVAKAEGPKVFGARYVTFSEIPPGTTRAMVRYTGLQRNTVCTFDFRIDADYREPHGGFLPVKITYVWEESGQERTDVHVAFRPEETYEILCPQRPTMKRLVVELAQ